MDFKEWANNDIQEERKKREKKAASAECTPISISYDDQSGVFSGTSGRYNTWLSECECVDYRRRLHPCKHMYRLAYELGFYNLENVKSDPSQIKSRITPQEREAALQKNIELIESYSEQTQKELQISLYYNYVKKPYVCENIEILKAPIRDGLLETINNPSAIIEHNTQKRTVEGMINAGFIFPDDIKATKKARYEWCLQNADVACSIVYPECYVLQPSGTLKVAATKTYTYLNQKFESVSVNEWFFQ